jgi:hypothetical protein
LSALLALIYSLFAYSSSVCHSLCEFICFYHAFRTTNVSHKLTEALCYDLALHLTKSLNSMFSRASHFAILALLASSVVSSPLGKRANDVVQGKLGTDEFWNDYDGQQSPFKLASPHY